MGAETELGEFNSTEFIFILYIITSNSSGNQKWELLLGHLSGRDTLPLIHKVTKTRFIERSYREGVQGPVISHLGQNSSKRVMI